MKKIYSSALALIFASGMLLFNTTLKSQTVLNFTYTGNLQTFTVPSCVSTMTIEAKGAQGGTSTAGNYAGGLGARMVGVFAVSPGQVLNIIVGGKGNNETYTSGGGGGSGVGIGNTPLIVAGGGAGVDQGNPTYAGKDAVVGTSGVAGGGGGGSGGTNGADGGSYTWVSNGNNVSQGGRGWNFNNAGSMGLNGSSANTSTTAGTWGLGGGGGSVANGYCNCGGGGGGYSGGGAAYINNSGGGGGSYNSGTNQTNSAGNNTGNGVVILTYNFNGNGVASNITPSVLCSGSTASVVATGMVSYTWSTGSNASSITVSPTVTTTYTVQGTNSVNCVSTSTITLPVDPGLPVLSITNASNVICPGKSTTLTATGATSYSWSNNVVNGVGFSPTVTTVYTATGSNACGSATASTSVTVNPTPTISITASTASLCSGNTATIIVGGAPTSTISNGVQNGVSFLPQQTAVYTATGTSALGCTATAQTTITVVQTPTAFPGAAPALICIGGTSTINVGGAQGYTWSTGSNQPSFTASPTITTVYTVTKTNGPCADIKSVTLTVAPLPFILALTNPTVVCSLKQITLSAAGAQTYTWAPFGGIGNGLVVTPTVTTIFTVTGNDGTCSNTATVQLNVLPNPTINIAATSTVLCLGECSTLTLGGASTYTWYTANLTGTNVTQCPTSTTSYSVAGTNSVGCTTGNTRVLVVNPVPNVNVFTNKPMVCSGQGSTLTVNGANTYTWSSGPPGTVTVVNPQTTTVYTVSGFFNGTGCNTTKTIQITVFSPTFQVPSTASSCIGGTVNLCASGADSYTWNGTFSFPCISVSPSVYTIYQVSATSTSLNINNSPVSCLSSNTVGVSIYLNPTITIAASRTTICKGESTNLTGIGGTTFTWSTFQQGTTVPVSPFVQTTYTVLGADANGCQGTAAIQIKVGQCTGLDELSNGVTQFIVYPNPNTGEFTIKSDQALRLQLVNEIGQVILSIDLKQDNGHSKTVTDLPNGVYFITGESNTSNVNRKVIVNR